MFASPTTKLKAPPLSIMHVSAREEKSFTSVDLDSQKAQMWSEDTGKLPPPHQHRVEWIMKTFLSGGKRCWVMDPTVSSGGLKPEQTSASQSSERGPII